MVTICPSILSADFSRLAEELKDVEQKGAGCIHIDMMDGHFVPNLTFGVPVIKALRPVTELPFDAHLMVTNPEAYIDDLADAGVQYVTVHQEACVHLDRVLQQIHEAGMKAGVALNPATPVSTFLCCRTIGPHPHHECQSGIWRSKVYSLQCRKNPPG